MYVCMLLLLLFCVISNLFSSSSFLLLQLKLKGIYSKFTKEADLARLLFKDLSFKSVVPGNTKMGQLSKQGGPNVKKWANRQFVLNEFLLFYYESTQDKQPKGIIRMDSSAVEKVDLTALGRSHA